MGDGIVAEYVHNKVADGLGKIGVLVALESKGDKAALASLGRQLAMHIAAANPAAITAEELDPALIERERAVYTEQAKASGKPPDIVAKMVEGRLRKEFYQQVVLLQQTFLGAGGDGKATVEQVLKACREDGRARPSRSPSSSAMRWARASRRRTTTSPPRSPGRRQACGRSTNQSKSGTGGWHGRPFA